MDPSDPNQGFGSWESYLGLISKPNHWAWAEGQLSLAERLNLASLLTDSHDISYLKGDVKRKQWSLGFQVTGPRGLVTALL